MRIHLDTDIGGNPDDACALAMLLGWPDVELTGVTTTYDPGGRRARYLGYVLDLAARPGVLYATGADGPLATRPALPEPAFELLVRGVDRGATLVGIGPLTNLALLERRSPGSLRRVPVVVMGGWVRPPAAGLPPWGPERDTNLQSDADAAELVLTAAGQLTLVPLPTTCQAPLRTADLARLRTSGPLGVHLAERSLAHARTTGRDRLGTLHSGLPDDLVNFHHDPVTCAVAAGRPGTVTEPMRLRVTREDGLLRLTEHPAGRPVDVVVAVDGTAFTETWLTAVEAAQR